MTRHAQPRQSDLIRAANVVKATKNATLSKARKWLQKAGIE